MTTPTSPEYMRKRPPRLCVSAAQATYAAVRIHATPSGETSLGPPNAFRRERGVAETVSFNIAELGGKDAYGEFVVNLADEPLAEALNHTSEGWAHGVDEFVEAGLTALFSSFIRRPRVEAAPAHRSARTQ